MGFNLEGGNNSEVSEATKVEVDSEKLSETEETAENFDDCALKEVQDSNGNEVNSESLSEAEENFDECKAEQVALEAKNPELAEDDDDFNDCGKETEGQYVAEVTYATDGEVSEEEADAELQEAYNECDDPEDMQQLEENANENEHIEVYNAEVVERPENVEQESEITEEETEEYERAEEEMDEAQENLEAQQEAAQEYQEDLEHQIDTREDETSDEGTENIVNQEVEETEKGTECEEIEEEPEVEETADGPETEEIQVNAEAEEAERENIETDNQKAEGDEKSEIADNENIEAAEKAADELEIEQTGKSSEQISLQERIDDALEKDGVSVPEINALRAENAAELKAKIEEKELTEVELKRCFGEVLSKEKGSEEYEQSLKKYNAIKDQKMMLDEQITSMEDQQAFLDEKRLEIRNAKIKKGNEAVEASAIALADVAKLQERYDQNYYKAKIKKGELANIKEDGCSAIKELANQKDSIKQAMDAKMDEISQYVVSRNMNRYDTAHDSRYQQLSADYIKLKENYSKIGYLIVKIDENNRSITKRLGIAETETVLPRLEEASLAKAISCDKGEYHFESGENNVRHAYGQLQLIPKEERYRNQSLQRKAGGTRRRSDDDGGHLIGARFGGPASDENLFPQNKNLNRSGYKLLENTWADLLRDDCQVYVDIYSSSSDDIMREDAIYGSYTVVRSDGSQYSEYFSFANESTTTQESWEQDAFGYVSSPIDYV